MSNLDVELAISKFELLDIMLTIVHCEVFTKTVHNICKLNQ